MHYLQYLRRCNPFCIRGRSRNESKCIVGIEFLESMSLRVNDYPGQFPISFTALQNDGNLFFEMGKNSLPRDIAEPLFRAQKKRIRIITTVQNPRNKNKKKRKKRIKVNQENRQDIKARNSKPSSSSSYINRNNDKWRKEMDGLNLLPQTR